MVTPLGATLKHVNKHPNFDSVSVPYAPLQIPCRLQVTPALIMLIQNTTVDHLLQLLVSQLVCGVNRMYRIKDLHRTQHTQLTLFLWILH